MNINAILALIDQEIERLQSARTLLTEPTNGPIPRGPGRPKKAQNMIVTKPVKRVMSAEARARIAAAQKKRWALSKRASK